MYPCVGASPKFKISFSLLSICTDEFISAPKIMAFLVAVLLDNK